MFIHTRRRIGYQLAVVRVVDFLCAVNTPSLRRDLESLKSFSCKAIPWKSPTVLQVLVTRRPALIQLASVIDEMHCDNPQKQLDFLKLLQT